MPKSTSTSTGLRKFVSQPDRYTERYGNFTLTGRDLKILETVYRYRYLEARHIRALVGGSNQQITRRLQGLFHNGYLGRYARRERMRMELDPGAPLMAYGLELRGARALERNLDHVVTVAGMQPAVGWRKDYTRRTEWFLEHHLMISNLRCILELAIQQTPDTDLVTWDQSKDIWFRIRIPGEQKRRPRIAPDAYFALRKGDQIRHFFLEADRSTEEHRQILDKIGGYWWYLQSPEYSCRHQGHRRINVLFVTTGEERLENLAKTLREWKEPRRPTHAGRNLFWLACDRYFTVDDPASILRPVWRNAKGVVGALVA